MLANIQDTTDGFSAGPGKYTGTVTASTPVTAGASAPSALGTNAQIAAYEIPQSGSIAIDGSTPANAQGTGVATITTASFTPPGGAVLVAIVEGNFSGTGGSGNYTISSTPTLTWTLRSSIGASGHNGFAGIYTATAPVVITSGPQLPYGPAVNLPVIIAVNSGWRGAGHNR